MFPSEKNNLLRPQITFITNKESIPDFTDLQPQTTFFLEEGATTEDKSLPHDSIMVPFWVLKTTSEQPSDLVLKLCFHWEDATYKIHRFSPFLPVQIKQMMLLHTLVRTNVTAVLLLDGPSLPYL